MPEDLLFTAFIERPDGWLSFETDNRHDLLLWLERYARPHLPLTLSVRSQSAAAASAMLDAIKRGANGGYR